MMTMLLKEEKECEALEKKYLGNVCWLSRIHYRLRKGSSAAFSLAAPHLAYLPWFHWTSINLIDLCTTFKYWYLSVPANLTIIPKYL